MVTTMIDEDIQQAEESTEAVPPAGGSAQETLRAERNRTARVFEAVGLFFLEVIKIAILAGVTIGLVRYFIFKPFYVQGHSMESTFFEKEYLIIDELTYRFREPIRGEVLVFHSPNNPGDFFLKRIIGLPGERVTLEDNKIIIYNDDNPQGVVLEETYLDMGIVTQGSESISLGPDQYYVLGDNREASLDSRRFGPIDKDAIVGRAWLRGYPLHRIGIFEAPDYIQ